MLLWWYCCLSFLADAVGYALSTIHHPMFWVSNAFILGEWLLISNFLIRQAFAERFRYPLLALSYLLGALFVARTIYCSPSVLNYDDAAVFFGLYVIGTLFGLYRVIQKIEFMQIEQSPLFVFCAAFLLYVSGSLIMLLARKYLDKSDHTLMRNIWVVHNMLNILKNLAIAYSLLLIKRQRIE